MAFLLMYFHTKKSCRSNSLIEVKHPITLYYILLCLHLVPIEKDWDLNFQFD
ncbi:hypothetical protein ABIE66_001864 [Peribacillus sp. B2I2]